MNVSLTVELERWVQSRVETGDYTSASEVVREALRAMREREELRRAAIEDLRAELAIGIEQLDAGLGISYDDGYKAEFVRRARERVGKLDE
jgi:antitoxin ParD1/3/4